MLPASESWVESGQDTQGCIGPGARAGLGLGLGPRLGPEMGLGGWSLGWAGAGAVARAGAGGLGPAKR